MSNFPMFVEAIRVVNASGVVIKPELRLNLSSGREDTLRSRTTLSYAKEEFGPDRYADFANAPLLNGFRPHVELEFGQILFDNHEPGAYGFSLLLRYYLAATQVTDPSFAPLQFNAYADNPASPWRGMFCASDWDPVPLELKQTSPGATWEMKLYARDLIDAPGDWAARTW